MNKPMKSTVTYVLLLLLGLFHMEAALGRSDDLIKRDIEAQFAAESERLRGAQIEIHVRQRLVVLIGEVRFYEQKLISERIAWTTRGVFEVDNEIQIAPVLPLSDEAIERKIREIVKAEERFHRAQMEVLVNSGRVTIKGSFIDFRDPSMLKHEVAKIEGVVHIHINATFLARSESAESRT